jgi:RNA polymerase-binding protein DksA
MRDETVTELDALSESLMPEVVAISEQPDEPITSVQTILMIQRQRKLLNLLEASLVRFAQGSYGTCSSCGNPIEMGRLEAIPYTTLCVECGRGKQE